MVHLELILQARKVNRNKLYITSNPQKQQIVKDIESTVMMLHKERVEEKTIIHLIDDLFNGLNSQIFNSPIDLFIEDYLYISFPELRPYQFLSLHKLALDYLDAVNGVREIEFSPVLVRESNTIMILLHVFQLKDLYGLDMLPQFKASDTQLKTAKELYQDYLDHRLSRQPGEEYDRVQFLGQKLKLDVCQFLSYH